MKKNNIQNKVYVALPAMDEADYLPAFIECIRNQSFQDFLLVVCVNQPENWWEMEDKLSICQNNKNSIEYLHTINDLNMHIIDRSSTGNGWKGKKYGVGWARKVVMDYCAEKADSSDIIISLDADTTFGSDYFSSIIQTFKQHPKAVHTVPHGICVERQLSPQLSSVLGQRPRPLPTADHKTQHATHIHQQSLVP